MQLIRIGLPSGMNMFLDVAMWGIFTSFVVGHFGQAQLAAHNISLSFIHLCFMPAVAVNQAIAPIVGQWIGRGRVAMAKQRTHLALAMCMIYMSITGVTLAVFGRSLVARWFSSDPEVIALCGKILVLAAFFQAFDAVNIVCMGALRGAGDTRWVLYAMSLLGYLFFIPLALLLSVVLKGEAFGAWVGATVFIVVLSSILLTRFEREAWRKINIFSETLTG